MATPVAFAGGSADDFDFTSALDACGREKRKVRLETHIVGTETDRYWQRVSPTRPASLHHFVAVQMSQLQ